MRMGEDAVFCVLALARLASAGASSAGSGAGGS